MLDMARSIQSCISVFIQEDWMVFELCCAKRDSVFYFLSSFRFAAFAMNFDDVLDK